MIPTTTDSEIEEMRASVRQHLLLVMREISEEFTCAGWYGGLEYYLWRFLQDPKRVRGLFNGLEHSARYVLRLANLAGGWWVWDKAEGGEKFVPMAEWEERYQEWKNAP